MKVEIAVRDRTDAGLWSFTMRPFISLRGQPFLLDAGVPPPMASAPAELRLAAQELLTEIEGRPHRDVPTGLDGAGRSDEHASDLRNLLSAAFGVLESAYGEEAADALYQWAGRHGVDPVRSRRLAVLDLILPGMMGIDASGSHVPDVSLPVHTKQRFVDVVRAQLFGPKWVELDARVALARTQPLSEFEAHLLAYDPEALDAGGPAPADELDQLYVMSRLESVNRVVAALRSGLSDGELTATLEWMRRQQEARGIRPETIDWPPT